jgi:Spy/CpxP family protein refolding chaperone
MLSKTKVLVFFLALLLITGSVYAAVPGEGARGDGDKIQRHNPLNLTPEQQTKFKDLRDNFRKETVFLRNDIKIKKLELKTLWTVPKPERDKIIAKQKELMDLVAQLQTKAVDFRLEFRNNLTPEQAAQAGLLGQWMGHKGRMDRRVMGGF